MKRILVLMSLLVALGVASPAAAEDRIITVTAGEDLTRSYGVCIKYADSKYYLSSTGVCHDGAINAVDGITMDDITTGNIGRVMISGTMRAKAKVIIGSTGLTIYVDPADSQLTTAVSSFPIGVSLDTTSGTGQRFGLQVVQASGGGGGSGHTIQDEGISLPSEPKLNFKGAGVTATDNLGVSTDVTISGLGTHDLLSATHTDTTAASAVKGDIIIADATPKWKRLAGNTALNNKFLMSTGDGVGGSVPSAWAQVDFSELTGTLALTQIAGTTDDTTLVNDGTHWVTTAIPLCTASTKVLHYDTTGNVFSCDTLTPTPPHPLLDASQNNDTVAQSPSLGSIIYGNVTPKWDELTGNTTTVKKYLMEQGDGFIPSAPSWVKIDFADVGGTASDAQIPDNITINGSGNVTLASLAPASSDQVLEYVAAWGGKSIPDCDDTVGQHINYDTTAHAWSCGTSSLGVTQAYQTVMDESSALTQRSTVNFKGDGIACVDNAGSTRTDCTVNNTYSTIQDEGGALTTRQTLNFTGAGVTCSDNAGSTRTDCNVPGPSSPTSADAQFAFTADISTNVTANQNAWNPTGLATAAVILATMSASTWTINGLTGGADGRVIWVINNDGSDYLTFANESPSASAGDRFSFPAGQNLRLVAHSAVAFIYNSTAARWFKYGGALNDISEMPMGGMTANEVYGADASGVPEGKVLATGTSGTDFAIAHTSGTITFNLPSASGSNRGAVTTSAQVFGGKKTFTPTATFSGVNTGTVSSDPSTPADGDIWYNTTTKTMVFGIRGTSYDYPQWQVSTVASDVTTSSAVADSTALTVTSLAASTNYQVRCVLTTDAAAITTGVQISVSGPASPTQLTWSRESCMTTTAGLLRASYNAYGIDAATNSPGTTRCNETLTINVQNGSNTGNLDILLRSEVGTSTVGVRKGSYCEWRIY